MKKYRDFRENLKERINEYSSFIYKVKKETSLDEKDPLFRKEMGLRVKDLKYKGTVFLILEQKFEKLDFHIMRYIRPKES